MYVLENLKKTLGRVTGVGKPSGNAARRKVRRSKPHTIMFRDDGSIPNNARLPFLLYRGAVGLTGSADPAAILEELFNANDWGDSWRNGIYEYVHYQSRTHEVLGIARGHARVRFGGNEGKIIGCGAGTSSSCRPAPAISASQRARSCWSSGLTRRPGATTNACRCPSTTRAP